MRVTHVITRLIVGGAQENTIASVLGLQQKPGLIVDLISGSETGAEGSLAVAFSRTPQSLTLVPDLIRAIHPWKDVMAWCQLVKLFRGSRPGIVHTHSGKAGVVGRLAARTARVPIIIHTIHGPSFGPFQGALANAVFLAAERRCGRVTTHFVAVADAMIRQYLAVGIGTPSHYSKILSGFSLPPFLNATNDPILRARYGLTPENIVVGKIARLFKLKGHEDLFRIAPELVRQHPQIRFLLVGDGPWRERFALEARRLNLEKHFIFTGLVPPAEVPQLVGIMDLLVHLSLREGLARALPQALAAGKPVVAYDVDGANEVCLENQTGFLLQPGDFAGLLDRLGQLAVNVARRERLGRRGREFVRERFSTEKMVDDLFSLYLQLASARKMASS